MANDGAGRSGFPKASKGMGETAMLSLAAVVLLTGPARSAPPPTQRAAPLQAVFDCRRLTDPQLRLACYDRAAGALDAAETQGEVVVVDRAQARQVRRQAFGLYLPSISLFQKGPKEEAVNRISTTLRTARQNGDGKWVFVTTEDQVWRQTDSETIVRPPHEGSTLAVRSAAMGSFFCNVDGQYAVRCERAR